MARSVLIRSENVHKNFGEFQALSGLNCEVVQGESVGLLGPNGAGKSTFIGMLYGVVRRSQGNLSVFGLDPNSQSREIKRRIGVVPQENALDDELTVVENMRVFARFQGIANALAKTRIEELLSYLNLDHKTHSRIKELSGGMKRRLAFVRALLVDPELLILDEPTTGLDPSVRHLLWKKVNDLKGRGKTVLITTHYMHEAEQLCDRIIILSNGKIVAEASPRDLIQEHAPGFVAMFSEMDFDLSNLKKDIPRGWRVYQQQSAWCLQAPTLELITEFQKSRELRPFSIRPSNLEDVYLKLTGGELGIHD